MVQFSRKPGLIRGGISADTLRTANSTLIRQRAEGAQLACYASATPTPPKWIDSNGLVVDPRVQRAISPELERGPMGQVHGIIVHQTDSSTSASTLEHYKQKGAFGAHFLIDKDGTIYQTAPVTKKTLHVGTLKSRCLIEKKCSKDETKRISNLKIHALSQHELVKSWPERYPSNQDSIGIELVGKFIEKDNKYESVTDEQNASLSWLIGRLSVELGVQMTEVFRHPDVSYKQPSEAATSKW